MCVVWAPEMPEAGTAGEAGEDGNGRECMCEAGEAGTCGRGGLRQRLNVCASI